MQRTLRLLMLLAGNRWYSPPEIETRIAIGIRTLYRYLHTLEAAGFVVERQAQRYRLASEKGSMLTLHRLLHFTEAEALLLYRTLGMLQGGGPAKERLLRKLHTLYDCHLLAQARQQHTLEIVATLQKAMERKLQCRLVQYRSSHSHTIADRLVEPFAFTEQYEAVWAWDTAAHTCKQYKLARMDGVELHPRNWQGEAQHQIPFTDAFGFAATQPLDTAYMRLSLLAANLLREEFPAAEAAITQTPDGWEARIPYASPKGIGRFIRGLQHEITLLAPETLIKYINAVTEVDSKDG